MLTSFPYKMRYFYHKELSWNHTNSNLAKICNVMLLNRILPEVDPIRRTIQNGFRTKRSTTGHILRITSKNLSATLLFIYFSKSYDSINREKIKDILIIYGIPTEIVNAILMLYTNIRYMVRSSDASPW